MSLLDQVMNAQGDATANYARPGKYVIRLNRLNLREANPLTNVKAGFRFDGTVLACSNESHKRGDVVTFTDPFKFVPQALARARRTVAAAKASKTGEECPEATLGLAQADGESEDAFKARIVTELKRLLGPSAPLTGAVVTIVVTGGTNQSTGKPYSLFEPFEPDEDDLKAAGILD